MGNPVRRDSGWEGEGAELAPLCPEAGASQEDERLKIEPLTEVKDKSEVEEPETPDDPVRFYLRQVGRTPLLTAEEEKILARSKEEKDHINEIEEECSYRLRRPPSAIDVVTVLLERLEQAFPLLQAVEEELALAPHELLPRRISNPQLRAALDGELDEQLIEAVSQRMNESQTEVEQSLKKLSLDSAIL